MKFKNACLTAISATLLVSTAMAAPGYYMYGGAGYSRADADFGLDGASIYSDVYATDEDVNEFGAKLAIGYRFCNYFALEGAYSYLGKSKGNADSLEWGNSGWESQEIGNISVKAHVFTLDGVFIYPVTEQFEVFAKAGAGVGYVKTDSYVIEWIGTWKAEQPL